MVATDQVMDLNESLLSEAKDFVVEFFHKNISDNYTYHNLEHTLDVSMRAQELAEIENQDADEKILVGLAALFHDTGFIGGPENHEQRSVEIASKWLKSKNISQKQINTVEGIILATQMGVTPTTDLQKIISDADLCHIGTKKFNQRTKDLRSEKETVEGIKFSDKEWTQKNIEFLSCVRFHTDTARKKFSKRKQKNIKKLQDKLEIENTPADQLEDLKLYKDIDSKKGVQTMFRTTLRNHNQLSKIADNKASIMLSISAIMLSIVVSTLAPKLDNNPHLTIPAIMVIAVCMLTIIFSILSARPKISNNQFSVEKFKENKFNILFFGNFASMKVGEFEWAMKELMKEPDRLYSTLSQDLYYLGVVLVKKYKLLNLAYTTFMVGMILSALAFVYAFITYDAQTSEEILDSSRILNNQ